MRKGCKTFRKPAANGDTEPRGYADFERHVIREVGEEAFDEWINYGLTEAVEDWFVRWMGSIAANAFVKHQLVVRVAVEVAGAFRDGCNRGVERASEALDEAEL